MLLRNRNAISTRWMVEFEYYESSRKAVGNEFVVYKACYEVNENGFVILLSACQGMYSTIVEN